MGSRILFLSIPASGHVFPTISIVDELVKRRNEVHYTAVGQHAETIAETGATVISYDSVDPVSVVTSDDSGRAPLAFLQENIAMLGAIESHFGENPPDLIAYDGVAAQAGRVLAKKWDRPAVQLSPVFASNEHYSFVEKMMEAAGPVDTANPAMAGFGRLLGELLASNGLEVSIPEFMQATENLNIVFVPREFQPMGETFDERFVFVGPCLGERAFLGEWEPPQDDRPLVLVSLGTVNNRDASFFGRCVEAFGDLPWRVVISVGGGIDPATLGPLPDNVEVHRFIPHLKVLEHASAAVIHGGMGTLMETLHFGCPTVVVPPFPDVIPNADRVAELKLGIALRPDDLTPERLRAALLEVVEDRTVLERLAEMRAHTRAAGGAVRAADEIEAYLGRIG
ncbi:dTDP-L-oleandrosyltransferase [Herbihabitans rhizosphaerae]|uniref:dTDP-L-oleandrosyltransferase n=1 Tax=Herbihabitans rhizosphaerae TaxID=1872711 RepID=A0A4Q7KIF8_9PSEU|nr:macrolide family glycosyltransferase [Herbihabitans rhizosphaerae]RZS36328.1 dTDP-L-oleandrosyltransferase [Herbihabitans rhizosphaerae]